MHGELGPFFAENAYTRIAKIPKVAFRPSLLIFVSATLFHVFLLRVNTLLAYCLNRFFNGKVVLAAFNQNKALVGAFEDLHFQLSIVTTAIAGSDHRPPDQDDPGQ